MASYAAGDVAGFTAAIKTGLIRIFGGGWDV